MWTNDDVVYALFILKANSYQYENLVNQCASGEDLCAIISAHYADLFSDRAICEEPKEISGWIADCHVRNLLNGDPSKPIIHREEYDWAKNKIKIRFVEGEKLKPLDQYDRE